MKDEIFSVIMQWPAKPKSNSLIDTLQETLEMLFETQIKLSSKDTVESNKKKLNDSIEYRM